MPKATSRALRKKEKWITIFDATRDNGGKGIPIDEFIIVLERSLGKKKP